MSDTIVFGGVVVPLEAAEAALTCRDDVAEAVAFGATDNFLGQALHVYVVLEAGTERSNDLRSELLSAVADSSTAFGPVDCGSLTESRGPRMGRPPEP